MKVITEERLRELMKILERKTSDESQIEYRLLENLLDYECQEIDTLTVSKLRPMIDAPKDGEWFLGYYKGVVSEYFEILFYSKLSGKLRSNGDEFNEEDVLGWLPMPIYKPELTGDGE